MAVFVLAALVVVAVFQEAQGSLLVSLPRFSTFCSPARGAAAANPKREEKMMVERMAMRTCENMSGKKRSLEGVFRSSGLFPVVLRLNRCGVRDLEAVDCVVSKIEKQRGLLNPLIESTFHAQRVTLVLIYRPHEATHCLQSLSGRVNTFWKASNGFETQKRCHEGKGVATRAFRSHNGSAPSKEDKHLLSPIHSATRVTQS